MEPEDSFIMGDENLSTIPEKEPDESIKSSVEDLVPILCESEDTLDNDSECDLPFCDDSPPLDVLGGNYETFSHPLFDANDDFTSSDEESLPEEDVSEENIKIYSNPLFNFDDDHTSFDANEDECFDPGGDIDKIDAFLDIDVSMDIEDGYHESVGDTIYLENLLINDTIPNLPPEVFLVHDPKSLNDEPNIDDLKIKENVRFTFEDRHYFPLTFVIRIFLPYLTYFMDSTLLLFSGSEDTIFDPDIFVFSFYSLEPVVSHRSGTFICFNVYLNILNESPIEIFSSTCFVPNITMI
ncbi:hypothetical protein Tco_0915533 [Tanacetum coccineum]|uniref:Uncharacterized protein n=1 Tax=Tanacetum coccineum TaxID=301880 RepID=A0ABQ5HZC9_9ASTR